MINKKTFISLLLVSFFFISCKTKDVGYYLKEKWKTNILPYTTLKAQPKRVIEYFYRGIEDINIQALPRHGSYESFTYNPSGDLTDYTFHLSNASSFSNRYIYTADGYKEVMTDQTTHGIDEKPVNELVKNSDGSYKETEWYATNGKKWATVRFHKKGNKIIKEQTIEGQASGNSMTITAEYDDQLLLKETSRSIAENLALTSTRTFYYSKEKWLDSVIMTFGGNLTRTLFVNNNHGDPLQEITITNNDTTVFYVRQYTYDQKNNWVRMLEKENKGEKTPKMMSPYVLISREIFY